jgi:hypothetical protein
MHFTQKYGMREIVNKKLRLHPVNVTPKQNTWKDASA